MLGHDQSRDSHVRGRPHAPAESTAPLGPHTGFLRQGYRSEISQHHQRDSPSNRGGCGPCVLSGQHDCGCGKFGTRLKGQVHLKATGRTRVEGIVPPYIVPRLGTTRLRDVSHAEVQSWVTELLAGGLSASAFSGPMACSHRCPTSRCVIADSRPTLPRASSSPASCPRFAGS
jgi:hypothetical protein